MMGFEGFVFGKQEILMVLDFVLGKDVITVLTQQVCQIVLAGMFPFNRHRL